MSPKRPTSRLGRLGHFGRPAHWLAVLLAVLGAPSCCLTARVWDDEVVRPVPLELERVVLEEPDVVTAAFHDSSGEVRTFSFSPSAVAELAAKRPCSTPVGHDPQIQLESVVLRDVHDDLAFRYGQADLSVPLPRPVDWTSSRTYGAVLKTPFTVAIDILSAPIHLLWLFTTTGGHGQPWVWWCEE